jgi:hypothetical protein
MCIGCSVIISRKQVAPKLAPAKLPPREKIDGKNG